MAERYISIRNIMDKILRHPLMQDLSLETAVDYAIDFMRIIGMPSLFEEKVVPLKVEEYRAVLPDDFYQMIQVRKCKGGTFRYATDSFHFSDNKKRSGYTDLTYKIQGNVIYTSIEEADIEISYSAIAVDDCGFPLLPDNSSFTRALELYIKKQWFTILFDMGKISPASFNQTLQDYAWAAGDCQSEFNRLTLDKAESFYNSWRTAILRETEHNKGFKNDGVKERIKLQ